MIKVYMENHPTPQDVPCKPGSYSCGIKYLSGAKNRYAKVRLVSLNKNDLYRIESMDDFNIILVQADLDRMLNG